jgi:transcriptional regulator with XRE-family HTH domain
VRLNIVLKELMSAQGLTLKQLSFKCGVPVQTLHNWQCGQMPRSLIQVKSVARVLAVSVDYLVFGEERSLDIRGLYPIPDGHYEVILRPLRRSSWK